MHNPNPGGILNFGLLRSIEAMQLAFERSYFAEDLRYAILCLALLADLGDVYAGRQIIICNKEGDFIEEWDPFNQKLYSKNRYYRMVETMIPGQYAKTLTPHFAKAIMPLAGWKWLMQNPRLLHNLLVALGQGDDDAGELQGSLICLNNGCTNVKKLCCPILILMEIFLMIFWKPRPLGLVVRLR